MEVGFDPRRAPRSFYEKKIAAIGDREGVAKRKLAAIQRERKWWEDARDMFAAEEAEPQGVAGQEPGAVVHEVVPPSPVVGENGSKPANIRAAIATVLRDEGPLRPIFVIQALQKRGWLPEAKSADQMIRNRMLDMHERDQLDKDDEGRYFLAPDVANTGLLRVDHTEDG